ncbi:MAG: hypothetical protein V4689_02850 [Verrucomicrobiota bacterium]
MSTNRGIFESFPNQPAAPQDSPFAIVNEPAEAAVATSPFAAVARQESPFTVVDEVNESRQVEPGRPARVPERRKTDSPFQVAEPTEGFGFEAPAKAASPFDTPPVSAPAPASPFSAPPQQQPAASPFSVEPQRAVSPSTQAAIAAFGNWQETPAAPAQQPFTQPTPSAFVPAPATQQAPAPEPFGDSMSDSFSIRQLELRAIFGVDREMNTEEILQRSRALPGMRNIARVNQQDMGTIEGLKHLLPNLGFGSGGLKLYAGSVPLEFIREGPVLLAVQTDGGFAPGVRETLMLVARELGRLS